MPKPLPLIVSSNKLDLVNIFRGYLLRSSYGYVPMVSSISKQIIKNVIIHKSFYTAFTRYEKIKPTKVSTAIDNLTNNIYDYFSKPFIKIKHKYDEWFKITGDKFLDDCRTVNVIKKFGTAQKIINVTMKHLYCYNINDNYFKYCHVALDSMTYTGRKINALDNGFYVCEVDKNAVVKSFSNLDWDEYYMIQNKIRDYLSKSVHLYGNYKDTYTNVNLTPFKAEFYIWPRYKK